MTETNLIKVNLACGSRCADGWVNIDFTPATSQVKRCNLLKRLPFKNNEIDIAYCSHFLEHLSKSKAQLFLDECYRILKPGGIFRIVVPDLENITREYLHILDTIDSNESKEKYKWITLELLDQMVRSHSGGDMEAFFQIIKNEKDQNMIEYIRKRTGRNISEIYNKSIVSYKNISVDKVKSKLFYFYLSILKRLVPNKLRNEIFISTTIGEKHRWMYDRYSLENLLSETGFKTITFLNAYTSKIPDFDKYHLDLNPDGQPYKESSLYCESVK